jgi:hypothetical protein
MLSSEKHFQLGKVLREFLKGGWESREDEVRRGAPVEVLRGEPVALLRIIKRVCDIIVLNSS